MLPRLVALCFVVLMAAAADAADKPSRHHRRLSDHTLSGADRTRRRDHDDRLVVAQFQPSPTAAGAFGAGSRQRLEGNNPRRRPAGRIRRSWRRIAEEKLQLRLEPPAGTGPGEYRFLVEAKGEGSDLKLPITVTIGQELPAKLKLTTNFPSLRGTATTSFKFRVTVANDSGRDATINFSADAPKNFQVTFTEAYGSQQLTSIPIEAGKSKDIEASVALPRDTPGGRLQARAARQERGGFCRSRPRHHDPRPGAAGVGRRRRPPQRRGLCRTGRPVDRRSFAMTAARRRATSSSARRRRKAGRPASIRSSCPSWQPASRSRSRSA